MEEDETLVTSQLVTGAADQLARADAGIHVTELSDPPYMSAISVSG